MNSVGTSSNIRSLIGTSSNIRSMGGYGDIHTLYGTDSLGTKEYEPDMVKDNGTSGEDDDDYKPDYVGDNGPMGYSKPTNPQIIEANDLAEEADDVEWKLNCNFSNVPSVKNCNMGDFHITSVTENNKIRIIQHPVENGTVRMDHKVVDPKKLTVVGWVKWMNVEAMNKVFDIAKKSHDILYSFTLVGKLGDVKQVYLADYTKRASSEKFDVFDYTIQLQEIIIDRSKTTVVDNAAYASTASKGGQGG